MGGKVTSISTYCTPRPFGYLRKLGPNDGWLNALLPPKRCEALLG
jgi:hypothetical protein